MAVQRWAVGYIVKGKGWQDMQKNVFTTYAGASAYVDALNQAKLYSFVVLQDEKYFKMF